MTDVNQRIANILEIIDNPNNNKVMIHLLIANELHSLIYEAKVEAIEELQHGNK